VALVARNAASLAEGVKALEAKGFKAAAFPADASDPAAIAAAIGKARAELGPIGVLHWNAYSGSDAGDILAADPAAVGRVFDVAIVGLLAAVQAVRADLKSGAGALLVTNGAFGENAPQVDALATHMKAMGVALANAAKYKLVGLLSQALKDDGVYVGEVMVAGAVKGTPFASGGEGIEASAIAAKFWELFQARGEVRARIS
jgi:NAD(P)-dependent dehydrogenase (short-subunit alcohol dehydrogenase family)